MLGATPRTLQHFFFSFFAVVKVARLWPWPPPPSICIYTNLCIYKYIQIYKERERESICKVRTGVLVVVARARVGSDEGDAMTEVGGSASFF